MKTKKVFFSHLFNNKTMPNIKKSICCMVLFVIFYIDNDLLRENTQSHGENSKTMMRIVNLIFILNGVQSIPTKLNNNET